MTKDSYRLKLAIDLAKIYVKWYKLNSEDLDLPGLYLLRDSLIEVIKELTLSEKKEYEDFCKKKWPNLDW